MIVNPAIDGELATPGDQERHSWTWWGNARRVMVSAAMKLTVKIAAMPTKRPRATPICCNRKFWLDNAVS